MASAIKVHQPALAPYIKDEPLTLEDVDAVRKILVEKHSLNLAGGKVAGTGLFSAATAGHGGGQESTGYHNVWVRDNVFLAHALYVTSGEEGAQAAVGVCESIAKFLLKHASRFDNIINGFADKADPMQRPHIRFNGSHLAENAEFWNHKQNDALGYFMWMRCRLCNDGVLPMSGDHLRLLGLMAEYFHKIKVWMDEDNGHWEEATKVEASSVGPVVAGVKEFVKVLASHKGMMAPCTDGILEELLEKGDAMLRIILPDECVQDGKERNSDGALLFLIYPLEVVSDSMAEKILQNALERITGPVGIRRYNGDSYWCKDYKEKTGSDATKAYTDEEMKERDKLVVPGEEAQWCIFDPIVSAIFGKWYQKTHKAEYLERQQYFLSRSLAQVTGDDCENGPWHCPESYYLSKGSWIPSDICPLLWTEANLQVALTVFEESLHSTRKRGAPPTGGPRKKPAAAVT